MVLTVTPSAATSQADRDLLIGLVAPREPIGVQEAAIAALGRTSDAGLPKALLKGWKGFSPSARSAVLDALVSRDAWASALLDLVDAGAFPRAEIDATHRAALLASRNDATRARAEALFAKRGYIPKQRNSVTVNGEWLANTTMQKPLAANDTTGAAS